VDWGDRVGTDSLTIDGTTYENPGSNTTVSYLKLQ
jgi:hypothetical protein